MSVQLRWGAGLALALVVALGVLGAVRALSGERAALLEVSGVQARVLERGDTLSIVGSGFPVGHAADVRLFGMMRRPGEAPRSLRTTLLGQASSSERVDVALDAAAYAKLGQRGSFDGSIELRFAAARSGGAVIGRLNDAQLDLLPSAGAMGDEQRLRERASKLLETAGIMAADADTLRGLVIARVEPNSSAARTGLRDGDVITVASGVRVHALSDLAPVPSAATVELQARRASVGAPLQVVLGLGVKGARAEALTDARLPLLLGFVWLVLLFASPLPSPSPLLLHVVTALREASSEAAITELGPRARVLRSFAMLAALAGLTLTAAAPGIMDATYLLACVLALSLYRKLRAPREVLGLLVPVGVLVLAVGAVAVSSGSSELGVVVAQQGVMPWAWKAFSHPELLLAFVMFIGFGARLLGGLRGDAAGELLARGALAVLGASLFMGGHAAPEALASQALGLGFGVLALSLKAALLMWLLARSARLAAVPSAVRLAVACAGVVAGTLVWLGLGQAHAVEAVLGRALFGTSVLGAVIAWVQVKRAQPSTLVAHTAPIA